LAGHDENRRRRRLAALVGEVDVSDRAVSVSGRAEKSSRPRIHLVQHERQRARPRQRGHADGHQGDAGTAKTERGQGIRVRRHVHAAGAEHVQHHPDSDNPHRHPHEFRFRQSGGNRRDDADRHRDRHHLRDPARPVVPLPHVRPPRSGAFRHDQPERLSRHVRDRQPVVRLGDPRDDRLHSAVRALPQSAGVRNVRRRGQRRI